MKKLNIKNLTVEVAGAQMQVDIEKALNKAFEQVSPEASFVNLIKVKVADMPASNVQHVLLQLHDSLTKQGLANCILVPLHPRGIQDITIEKLEWSNEK